MIINRMICLSNVSTLSPIEVQQNNYNSNFVRLTVFETPGRLFDTSVCDVTVVYKRDGEPESKAYEVDIEADNTLLFVFPEDVTKKEGKGFLQLGFYGTDGLLYSHQMPFVVRVSIGGKPGSPSDPSHAFFSLLNEARQSFENTPYIGEDGYWWIWSVAQQEYVKTAYPSMPDFSFSVASGPAGSNAEIVVGGTKEAPELHFVIPEGQPGAVDGVDYYGAAPAGLAAKASPGTANGVARGDHVHPLPSAESVGAVPADGTAANSSKLGGKLPDAYRPALNLLDNSNFANPVNQDGVTSKRSDATTRGFVYTIDRWAIATKGSTVGVMSVIDGGVAVTDGELVQLVAGLDTSMHMDGSPNTTYTFAVGLADGSVRMVSGNFVTGATANGLTLGGVSDDVTLARVGIGKMEAVWAALYEGEYTAETLPPYVPRTYTQELLECQRYYLPKNGSANSIRMLCAVGSGKQASCTYYMHAPMVKRPSCSIGDVMIRGNGKSVTSQPTDVAVTAVTGDELVIALNYGENVLSEMLYHAAVVYTNSLELDSRLY